MRESKAGRTVLHISGDVLLSSSFGWQWAVQRERERERGGERERQRQRVRRAVPFSTSVEMYYSPQVSDGNWVVQRETERQRDRE